MIVVYFVYYLTSLPTKMIEKIKMKYGLLLENEDNMNEK